MKCSTAKVPSTATGSVMPVITVLRHDPRNSMTISTVSTPPSTSVFCTLLSELVMPRAVSRTTTNSTSGGTAPDVRRSATAACRP